MAVKVRQKLPPRLVLVHGWLFPVPLRQEVLEVCLDNVNGVF